MDGAHSMRPIHFLSRTDREETLNIELLEQTKSLVPSIPVLINMISKRVRQLNAGFRPYVKRTGPNEENVDVAMREIVEGKLIAEINFADTSVNEEILG